MSGGYSTRIVGIVNEGNTDKEGVLLGQVCIAENYSVKEVAEYFGVSRMTVYRWFRGYPVSLKYLPKVRDLIAKIV